MGSYSMSHTDRISFVKNEKNVKIAFFIAVYCIALYKVIKMIHQALHV